MGSAAGILSCEYPRAHVQSDCPFECSSWGSSHLCACVDVGYSFGLRLILKGLGCRVCQKLDICSVQGLVRPMADIQTASAGCSASVQDVPRIQFFLRPRLSCDHFWVLDLQQNMPRLACSDIFLQDPIDDYLDCVPTAFSSNSRNGRDKTTRAPAWTTQFCFRADGEVSRLRFHV